MLSAQLQKIVCGALQQITKIYSQNLKRSVLKTFFKMSTEELLRISSGNEFHIILGVHTAKDLSPYIRVLENGSVRSPLLTDRNSYDKLKAQTDTTGP